MYFQKEKFQNFINAFSHKKKNSFKHTSYMHSKKSCIHKSIFFQKKNLLNMHYICIKKNHVFISASSEKIHASIHSNVHFSKKKLQNFIMRLSKEEIKFSKKRGKKQKKRKMWWVICSWIIEFTRVWIIIKWDSFKQNVNKGKS